MAFYLLHNYMDFIKKIFKSVKLIANVPKSGMTVNNNKTKKDGVKNKYAARSGRFQYLVNPFI